MKKTGGLGKGLDALIPDTYVDVIEREANERSGIGDSPSNVKNSGLALVSLDKDQTKVIEVYLGH